MALDTGSLVQMTDIRTGPPAGEPGPGARPRQAQPQEEKKGTDSQEFVKKEEKELLEVVREQAAKKEEDEARKKRENPRKPFNLQERQTITALALTPDEKYVIASVIGARYRNEERHCSQFCDRIRLYRRHPLAQQSWRQSESRPARDSKRRDGRSEVGGSWAEAAARARGNKIRGEAGKDKAKPVEKERDVQLGQPVWSEDGTKAAMLARAADNKDRWILALDEATGKTRVIEHDHDDAWVDGPGAFTLGWMKSDRDLYFQSERTGYSHLYTVSFEGGEPQGADFRQLGSGWSDALERQDPILPHHQRGRSGPAPGL